VISHIDGKAYVGSVRERVLRKTLGTKRDEESGDWMKLHIEELHEFYSPNIILVIK
jgi:hypothetical protein